MEQETKHADPRELEAPRYFLDSVRVPLWRKLFECWSNCVCIPGDCRESQLSKAQARLDLRLEIKKEGERLALAAATKISN